MNAGRVSSVMALPTRAATVAVIASPRAPTSPMTSSTVRETASSAAVPRSLK